MFLPPYDKFFFFSTIKFTYNSAKNEVEVVSFTSTNMARETQVAPYFVSISNRNPQFEFGIVS